MAYEPEFPLTEIGNDKSWKIIGNEKRIQDKGTDKLYQNAHGVVWAFKKIIYVKFLKYSKLSVADW